MTRREAQIGLFFVALSPVLTVAALAQPATPEVAVRQFVPGSGHETVVRRCAIVVRAVGRAGSDSGRDAAAGGWRGELYRMPSGRLIEGSTSADRKVVVGQFGPVEMPFVLRRVDNAWRVEAEPYFALINR